MIFTQVFQASGIGKNSKPYIRWDYKTADGQRFAHFAGTQEIPLNTEVTIETSPSGSISSWAMGGSVPAANQQAAQESQNGSQAVRSAPVASQTPSGGRDFQAEAEGKTRCALVSGLLPAMFTALDAEDQTPEGAEVLLDWAFAYVFQTDQVPF